MFEVFYYNERLDKWIKACEVQTEEEAREKSDLLKKLWGQPTKYRTK